MIPGFREKKTAARRMVEGENHHAAPPPGRSRRGWNERPRAQTNSTSAGSALILLRRRFRTDGAARPRELAQAISACQGTASRKRYGSGSRVAGVSRPLASNGQPAFRSLIGRTLQGPGTLDRRVAGRSPAPRLRCRHA